MLIPLMQEMQREHGIHLTMAVLLLDTHSHVPTGAATVVMWETWAEVIFSRLTGLKKTPYFTLIPSENPSDVGVKFLWSFAMVYVKSHLNLTTPCTHPFPSLLMQLGTQAFRHLAF